MRRGLIAAGALIVAVLGGCGSPPRKATPLAAGLGQRIGVVEFSMEGARVEYDGQSARFGPALAEAVAADLRRRGYQAEAFPAAATPSGDLIVRGRITVLDRGSHALRYWASFGAGATKLAVEGIVVRADGSPVGSFSDERRSGTGSFGGTDDNLLLGNLKEVAEDIGEMIAIGDYNLHQ